MLLVVRQTAPDNPLVFVLLNISLQRQFHTEIFLAFNPGTSHSSSFSSIQQISKGCKGINTNLMTTFFETWMTGDFVMLVQ